MKLKELFPCFSYHKNLVYLDNAATTQKPKCVLDAMQRAYVLYNANPHRGSYKLCSDADEQYHESRQKIKNYLNADSLDEIIFTSGATSSFNQVVSGLSNFVKKGDLILITELEHNSNLLPWQELARREKVQLEFVKLNKNGTLDMEHYQELMHKNPTLVSLSHSSNVLGIVNDIKQLTSIAHKCGAKVIVDGSQYMAHRRVNVKDLGCDAYIFSGHKMYGGFGVGITYLKKDSHFLTPSVFGGHMADKIDKQNFSLNEMPFCFEAGTPNMPAALSLSSAIDFLTLYQDEILKIEAEVYSFALRKLSLVDGIKFLPYQDYTNQLPILSFYHTKYASEDIVDYLNIQNIAVRVGKHCAHILFDSLQVSSSIRISIGAYNTKQDIVKLVDAIEQSFEFLDYD